MKKYLFLLKKTKLGVLIIFSFIFLNMQNLHADDIRLHEYIADGFDLPVDGINDNNYGFEYSQPWSITGIAPFSTLHPAIDINTFNDCGREVKASANGIIKYKGDAGGSWGGVVLIQHRFYQEGGIGTDDNDNYVEFTTQYAHIAPLDSIAVNNYVYRGQKIGYIARGNAQNCEDFDGVNNPHQYDVTWSAHLHFEVRSDENVAAANWPILSRAGTGIQRKNRVDTEGYFLPFESPYVTDNYPNEDNAQSLFADNTEANTQNLIRLMNQGAMTYTEDNAVDRNRNNKNHVLTKRQIVEIIANSLYLKENNSLPNDPVQYAVDQGLISTTSPQQDDFDNPVKREITFIVAARATQVIIEGSVTNLANCSSSDFQDINTDDISCKYANYLHDNNVFDGFLNEGVRRSFNTSYATRTFVADLGVKLLDLESTPPPSGNCVSTINLNQSVSVSGNWASNCASTHRSGRYAKFYTFTLSSSQEVTIDLQSSTDTYLYLLSGSGTNGSVVSNNDDSNGSLNSQIIHTLSAGTYTIEATTYSSGATGSFGVSIGTNTTPPPSGNCVDSISLNQSMSGNWVSNCASTHRSGRYAKFYTFTLSSSQEVTIDLQSSTDTYLYLLSGSGTNGSVVSNNDDSNGSLNSQIVRTLPVGTYTIEATTYSSGATGSFDVSVSIN